MHYVWYLISLSTESHISKAMIHTRILAQYACSTLLILAIASALLHFQAAGVHLMSTWNDSSFTTDLMILVFLASILTARILRKKGAQLKNLFLMELFYKADMIIMLNLLGSAVNENCFFFFENSK